MAIPSTSNVAGDMSVTEMFNRLTAQLSNLMGEVTTIKTDVHAVRTRLDGMGFEIEEQ